MHDPAAARQDAPDACAWPDASHGATQNVTSSETFSTPSSAASSASYKGAPSLAEDGSPAQAQASAGDSHAALPKTGEERQTRDQAHGQADGQAGRRRPEPEAHASSPGDSLQERRMKSLLPEIARRGSLTRKEYQELAGGVSMRTAQYDLQTLVRQGLLETKGRGPALRYVYTGKPEVSGD